MTTNSNRNLARRPLLGLPVILAVAIQLGGAAEPPPQQHWEIKFIKAGGLAKLKANGKLIKFTGRGGEGNTWTMEDPKQETKDITPFCDAAATEITLHAELSKTKDGDGELALSIEVRYGGQVVESWNVVKKEETHTFKRKL